MINIQTFAYITRGDYIEALQNRNKTMLLSILEGEDLSDTPMLINEGRDRERSKGERAIRMVVNQIIRHTGIGDILPLQQLGRLQGVIERAQSRFFQDIRMSLADISVPLERWASDVVFQYESLVTEYYQGAAVGSLIGGAVGYIFLGPVGGAIGSVGGGGIGANLQIQFEKGQRGELDFQLGDPSSADPAGIVDFLNLIPPTPEAPPWVLRGGMPFQGRNPTPKRPRQLFNMEQSTFGRRRP